MKNTKQVVVRQVHGITFAAKGDSNHWVMMDGPETFEGSAAASTPKELLMMALGGCTASDVIPILKKKRVPITGVTVKVSGAAREELPQVFTDLHIEYIFYGENIIPADIERAIELSMTKYCSVSAMLSKAVAITHSYRIESPAKLVPDAAPVLHN